MTEFPAATGVARFGVASKKSLPSSSRYGESLSNPLFVGVRPCLLARPDCTHPSPNRKRNRPCFLRFGLRDTRFGLTRNCRTIGLQPFVYSRVSILRHQRAWSGFFGCRITKNHSPTANASRARLMFCEMCMPVPRMFGSSVRRPSTRKRVIG